MSAQIKEALEVLQRIQADYAARAVYYGVPSPRHVAESKQRDSDVAQLFVALNAAQQEACDWASIYEHCGHVEITKPDDRGTCWTVRVEYRQQDDLRHAMFDADTRIEALSKAAAFCRAGCVFT